MSNPRIDSIVVYIDTSVSLAADTPDGQGAAKAIIAPGTPNANPTAPNAAAIQSAMGGAYPYTVVANVRVGAGVSTLSQSNITDVRDLVVLDGARAASFRAKLSAAFNVATSTFTKVPFDTITTSATDNILSAYDTTNRRFVAPRTGWYNFSFFLLSATAYANSYRHIATFYVNGSEAKRVFDSPSGGGTNQANVGGSCLIRLAKGDYVEAWMWHNVGTTQSYGSTSDVNAHFEGSFLKAA
ncbi:hypothetical protein [Streptomyces sp. NPDC056401]|uniref:C1q-like domain-containing protein n=1 Tax=Streptomyces sp. NPDC056401 TaxID=3345809 RepID=UPI0035E390DD